MRALVTGANRGIGLALTRHLLRRDGRVFATCRNPAAATDLHDLSSDYGSLLSVAQLDVCDPASKDASFEAVSELTDALDLLVNNAGVKLSDDHIGTLKMDEMLRTFVINSMGSMLVCRRYLNLLEVGESPRSATSRRCWAL